MALGRAHLTPPVLMPTLAGRLSVSVHAAATLEALKPKTDLTLIPGGKGAAVHMKKGDTIKISNTHGTQVLRLMHACAGNHMPGRRLKPCLPSCRW